MGFIPGDQIWFNIYKLNNEIHHINKINDKNYRIITTEAEQASYKTPFMIKTLNKWCRRNISQGFIGQTQN